MDRFTNETGVWLDDQIALESNHAEEMELELGVLIAAASDWTEDEMELDDLVSGLVESGRVQFQIGSSEPAS